MAQTLKISDGDININPANGRFTTISGNNKIKQDILEFFTIEVLPNGFGAGLEQLIGVVESSPDMFISIADRQVREGISVFVRLINRERQIPRTAKERVVGLSNMQLSVDPADPTRFFFHVNILTEDGQSTPVTNT